MNALPGHTDPQDPSRAVPATLRAFFRNQECWLERLSTGDPDSPEPHTRIRHDESVTTVRTGRSGVMTLNETDPETLRDMPAIERSLAWLRYYGQRDLLVWSMTDRPELTLALLARGFDASFRPWWMARSLREPNPPGAIRGVLIRAGTPEDIRELGETSAIPYLVPEQLVTTRMLALHPERRVVWWLVARDRKGIVGQAIVNLTDEIAGLFNVAVHPRARRRGIGRALTIAAMRIAQEAGATEMGLNATPEGLSLYEGLGFRHIGEGMTWLMPSRRSRLVPDPRDVAIAEALGRGRIDELAGEDMPARLPNGETPMLFAARFGQQETVRWLLDAGAEPDVIALWDTGLEDEAIRAMASPALRDRSTGPARATPLHIAIERDDVELAKALIDAGASLSTRDAQFRATPLEWAEHLGREEIARMLRQGSGS
jgi:ribosomal protein S18 acetylase RimI-like enzyme